ncbi:MAG: hypothetical protein JXR75_10165 [Rhodobacteraceae bacterium]|nr:hypothetical protein [Paracoccaceae bacterium]
MKMFGIAAVLFCVGGVATACDADGATAVAQDVAYLPGGVLTYEVFEAAVTHEDVDTCPAEFDPERVFCRVTLAGGAVHVFVFDLNDDQPLLAVKPLALDQDGVLPF